MLHMEKNEYFLKKHEIFNFFPVREEREFYITTLGYHNFHFVKGENYFRTQTFFTLHYVVSGKGYLCIGDKKYEVSQNNIFYLDNKTTFAYYPDKDEPWEYVFFCFNGEFAENYAAAAGLDKDNPIARCSNAQMLKSTLYNAFCGNNFSGAKADDGNQPSYFIALSAFFGVLNSALIKREETAFFYENDFIEAVKNFIAIKYLSPDFDIPYLCNSLGISHSHLCRIFKQKEHIPLISYINNIKMQRAESLLTNKNLSLKEIALMSGYRDYEYFLRLFKKYHGISPTRFKEKL